jgi:hypothetical protein
MTWVGTHRSKFNALRHTPLGNVYYWCDLMAACLIASLRVALLYKLLLGRFIVGFTVGAVR